MVRRAPAVHPYEEAEVSRWVVARGVFIRRGVRRCAGRGVRVEEQGGHPTLRSGQAPGFPLLEVSYFEGCCRRAVRNGAGDDSSLRSE